MARRCLRVTIRFADRSVPRTERSDVHAAVSILLDLAQPVMDGRQVVRELRSRPVLEGIPIALVSGECDFAHQTTELSAADSFDKPSIQALVALVERLAGPPDRSA